MNSPTGPAATLQRLRAVAGLTFKEAIRRKIFLVVIIVGVAIVSSAAFFPAIDAAGRLRLVQVWSLRTVTIFCSLGAIFLAGFSLPGDFEQRRVYTLVTKPIHKSTLFLGKFIGFVALMAVFLLIMAVITVAYLRIVAATSRDFPPLVAHPTHLAAEFTGERHLQDTSSNALAARETQGGVLIWKFRGLAPEDFDSSAGGKFQLDLGRDSGYALQGAVRLEVLNRSTGKRHEDLMTIQTNRYARFQFPPATVGGSDEFEIRIAPTEPGLQIASRPDHVKVFTRSVSFELNFLAGMILVLLQSTLVLLITLAGTTIVSGPVSILLGIFLFFAGNGWTFVRESLVDVDTALAEVTKNLETGARPKTPEEIPSWMLEVSSFISKGVLAIVPNFDDYNFSEWALADLAVGGRDLAKAGRSFAPLALILVAVGLLGMRVRDFAT